MKKSLFFVILACGALVSFYIVNVLADPPSGKGKNKDPYPILIPQTGQTISDVDGDDGDLQNGMVLPDPRFIDNGDGTVTDVLTNFIWVQNAQLLGEMDWYDAIEACNDLIFADEDDWRLPNVREMHSIIDYGYDNPCLTDGHPFINVPGYPGIYWTSTTRPVNENEAYYIPIVNGAVNGSNKTDNLYFVWPVRGGK